MAKHRGEKNHLEYSRQNVQTCACQKPSRPTSLYQLCKREDEKQKSKVSNTKREKGRVEPSCHLFSWAPDISGTLSKGCVRICVGHVTMVQEARVSSYHGSHNDNSLPYPASTSV